MTTIDSLAAIEAIRSLKARYFRAMDTKDWSLLGQVFTEDAQADFRGADVDPATGESAVPGATGAVLAGREAIVAGLSAGLGDLVTVHAGFMPEIEVQDDTNASGIWAMSDLLRFPDGPISELRGWGHYHERYVRVDGQWRIATMRLKRLLVQTVKRG